MNSKLTLWKFTLRRLAITRSDWEPFVEWVVLSGTTTEKEAVMKVKGQKFTSEWGDGVLIQEVEYAGEVWHMEEM